MKTAITAAIAAAAGYTADDIKAGTEFYKRKNRLSHPPGHFDKKGRFYASERTQAVLSCRSPSAARPYAEMKTARTAAHVAEMRGVDPLRVKRIAKAINLETSEEAPSAHSQLALYSDIVKTLKKVG